MSETIRLLEAARSGDRAAFDDLYRRHHGRLLAFVGSRLRGDLARFVAPEDIVQETHLESARRIDRFEPAGERSFYRWLVGIAANKLREAERARRAKKRAAVVAPLDAEPPGDRTSPSRAARRDERRAMVVAALAELPAAQADAVRLRYLEGLGVAETARRLGRSESAVKALVSRALTDLVRRVNPDS